MTLTTRLCYIFLH